MIKVVGFAMYPSMMIEYGLLSRNISYPELFKDIYDKRIQFKAAGDKKNAGVYKIVINSVFGLSKDKYSKAYDPHMANAVCLTGQLMLVDYINTLEKGGVEFELLQSN